MLHNNFEEDFNLYFWSFIAIIINDNALLSKKGKLLKMLVPQDGFCDSITNAAHKMDMHIPTIHKLCYSEDISKYIVKRRVGGRININFNPVVLEEGRKLLEQVLGK